MPGPAVRFDYQSIDPEYGRLYISHMNADELVVLDTVKRTVIATLREHHHGTDYVEQSAVPAFVDCQSRIALNNRISNALRPSST